MLQVNTWKRSASFERSLISWVFWLVVQLVSHHRRTEVALQFRTCFQKPRIGRATLLFSNNGSFLRPHDRLPPSFPRRHLIFELLWHFNFVVKIGKVDPSCCVGWLVAYHVHSQCLLQTLFRQAHMVPGWAWNMRAWRGKYSFDADPGLSSRIKWFSATFIY